ncbi:MAG: DeoR/GlpR family DNA-binding transcription regulator [Angelakisella sp.]
MNKKEERLSRLTDIIKARHYVHVKELAALLGVSEMTIRRDIALLQQNSVMENVNGNIVCNPLEYSLTAEAEKQNAQKDEIGRFAASLIEPDDIIILDTGSTTEKIARYIPDNFGISALCYNVNILMELRRKAGVELLFSGGRYHGNTQMFECAEGIEFIRGIRAQKVFVSAAGVHSTLGITCVNSYEVPTKRAILASSLQRILVADSQKFEVVRPAYFCQLADIDVIVTDAGLPQEWRDRIAQLDITLHIV